MRIYLSKRIFMNEADASPGNGAPVASPVPAEQPAVTAAPAPSVTLDQVKGLMGEMLTGFKNATFAELRKAGALGKEKPSPEPPSSPAPQSPPAAAPASSGLSAADVEAMLETERVITRVQLENKLSDTQVKRMKSALKADRPEDVSAWATTYLADMGLVRATDTQSPVTQTQPPQSSGSPISDKGSPAPGQTASWERELAERPLSMSAAARSAMIAKFGEAKAKKMIVDAAAQLHGMSLRVTPK